MAAAAADWKEERSAMEDGDIEDCLLAGTEDDEAEAEAEAEAGSLDSQRWPRSFRCVRASLSPRSRFICVLEREKMSRIADGSARASKAIE